MRPVPEHTNKYDVRPPIENADHGITQSQRQFQAVIEKHQSEHAIGPGVERPLMSPTQRVTIGKRSEIEERPDVLRCGSPIVKISGRVFEVPGGTENFLS